MDQQNINQQQVETQSVEDLEVPKDEAEETRAGDSSRNGNLQIAQFHYGASQP